jgi:hypothetical protein
LYRFQNLQAIFCVPVFNYQVITVKFPAADPSYIFSIKGKRCIKKIPALLSVIFTLLIIPSITQLPLILKETVFSTG